MIIRKIIFTVILFCFSLSGQEKPPLYAEAMKSYSMGNYADAYDQFKFFLHSRETDDALLFAGAQFYAAEAQYKAGNLRSAAYEFEKVNTNYKLSNYREESLYRLGQIYYELNEQENARNRFTTLIEDYPETVHYGSALYWIGESFTHQEKYNDAIRFFIESIESKKNNSHLDYSIYTLAGIYEKTGDFEKAVKYYDLLLSYYKDSPLAPSAQARIGYCYFRLKDYESALIELSHPVVTNLPPEKQAEAFYMLGNSFFRTGDYLKAQQTFETILSRFSGLSFEREIRYSLAWSYFQQKKYYDAYKLFSLLSEGKDTISVKSAYWKGESQRYAGNDTEALKTYEDFLRRFPNDAMAQGVQYQIGLIYFNNKQYDRANTFLLNASSTKNVSLRGRIFTVLGELEIFRKKYQLAIKYFTTVLEIPEIESELEQRSLLGLGVALYSLEKYTEAIEKLTDLDLRNPNFESDKVNFYLAESYYNKGQYKEALQYYKKVNQAAGDLGAYALYGIAYSQYNLRDYTSASFSLQDFIKKFPKDGKIPDIKIRLGDTYFALKKYEQATQIYEDILKLNVQIENKDYVNYQLGLVLYRDNKIQRAISEFNKIITRYPQSVYAENAIYLIGWMKFQQGNFSGAIDSYSYLIMFAPKSKLVPLAYYSIGDSYFNIGNYDSAIVNYTYILDNYPTSSYAFDAINGIQYCYVAQGNVGKAIELIDTFVKDNRTLNFADQLYFKKGELYYSERKYQSALTAYNEFITLFPKSKLVPDAIYWVGKCALDLNNLDLAIGSFSRVFSAYPSSPIATTAVIEWTKIMISLNQYSEAVNLLKSALEKITSPQSRPELLFMQGSVYLMMGNKADAYDSFDEIIIYHKGSIFADKARIELSIIEIDAMRYSNAEKNLQAVLSVRNDDIAAKAQFYLGIVYFNQQKIQDAITQFVRVLNRFANYDEWVTKAYLKLGECYEKLKDNKKAKEMYQTVLETHRGDEYGKEAQARLRNLK